MKKQSKLGLLIMLTVFILIIVFFILFQLQAFNNQSNFLEIFLWSFILIFALTLFDSFFIDLLLIGKIRPSFLNIPPQTNMESMRVHVIKTFSLGWIFIIPIVLVSSLISYYIIL